MWSGCRMGTPPEVRAQRESEKHARELDRDYRTVFAYNLNLKADEKDIFEFFSTAGQVEDVRIIMDRNTRRSKGFAYIEMSARVRCPGCPALPGWSLISSNQPSAVRVQIELIEVGEGAPAITCCWLLCCQNIAVVSQHDIMRCGLVNGYLVLPKGCGPSGAEDVVLGTGLQDSVMGALALGGQQLMGQTVMVKSSEAEKNLQWEQAQMMNSQQQMVQQQMGLAGALPGGPCRLHVRNLHVAMAVSVIVPLWGLLLVYSAPLRILVDARTPGYHHQRLFRAFGGGGRRGRGTEAAHGMHNTS